VRAIVRFALMCSAGTLTLASVDLLAWVRVRLRARSRARVRFGTRVRARAGVGG